MCGICGVLIKESAGKDIKKQIRVEFNELAEKISHRGPDRSIIIKLSEPIDVVIDFERLSIMDPSTKGDQPFKYEENQRTIYTICNGEIYGFKDICKKYDFHLTSGSDCEVIPLLYKKFGIAGMKELCRELNSEHAFAILDIDMKTGDYKLVFSSDRFGIRPLFIGWTKFGFYFSSELQGLPADANIERFKPRHYAIIEKKEGKLGELLYYPYYTISSIPSKQDDLGVCLEKIRNGLESSVVIRLESDREFGALLSGGLDSSLVSALAAKHLKKAGKKLRTFSIGMPGGTDEKYAKMVATFIDSDHTHVEVSESDFVGAIPDIVKTIGSYDITTVRASTGQYLISKWISENTNIKVLLIGDVSDELAGSYKYFLKAPSPEEFHNECVRLLEDIHLYDVLRADRCIARFGIEARLPFADYRFVELYLGCAPELRMAKRGIEKWLLREAFRDCKLLPEEVRLRSKEAFSDGVSSTKRSYYQIIQENVEKIKLEQSEFKHLPPHTKEALYYRTLFCKYFGTNESIAKTIPYFWLPKWSGNITDPSARLLDVYNK